VLHTRRSLWRDDDALSRSDYISASAYPNYEGTQYPCVRGFLFPGSFLWKKKISWLAPTQTLALHCSILSLLEKEISVRRTSLVGISRDLMDFHDGKDKGIREWEDGGS
jgi:hypothetical protein